VRAIAVDDSGRSAAAVGSVTAAGERARDTAVARRAVTPAELRALAFAGLPGMFDRSAGLFSFRVKPHGDALVREGVSRRYTAITLIGLAPEADTTAREILGGRSVPEAAAALVQSAGDADSIGDLALIAWAATLAGGRTDGLWRQIEARQPVARPHPTVEVAWALSAASVDGTAATAAIRESLAGRIRQAMSRDGLFPHVLQPGSAAGGGRSHVACFADMVYPVLALAQHGASTGDASSTGCAASAAAAMCRLQGGQGQWWWHFDYRTGRVLERYPVYAVHQDSMAPMALFAAGAATGRSHDAAIAKGLDWLTASPELNGGSLIDRRHGIVWRKVARREPGKLSRYLQAGASLLSPALRAPGLDTFFPPRAVDYEDRAYHLGWVLFAWPERRAADWRG
jgi:hypothetical protein